MPFLEVSRMDSIMEETEVVSYSEEQPPPINSAWSELELSSDSGDEIPQTELGERPREVIRRQRSTKVEFSPVAAIPDAIAGNTLFMSYADDAVPPTAAKRDNPNTDLTQRTSTENASLPRMDVVPIPALAISHSNMLFNADVGFEKGEDTEENSTTQRRSLHGAFSSLAHLPEVYGKIAERAAGDMEVVVDSVGAGEVLDEEIIDVSGRIFALCYAGE